MALDLITRVQTAFIGARVYHNANQSISDITYTALAFNSERFDTAAIHDTSTNNSRLTCKVAGKHRSTFAGCFDANATGIRAFYIRLNGSAYIARAQLPALVSGGTAITISADYDLALNDYVEAVVYQSSGGALNLLAIGNDSPEFSLFWVGA